MPTVTGRNTIFTLGNPLSRVLLAIFSLAITCSGADAFDDAPQPQPTFAIVHDWTLKEAAEAWAAYRAAQGWVVTMYSVPGARVAAASPEIIREWIRQQHTEAVRRTAPWPAVSVLLLGDVPEQSGSVPFPGIQTFYIPQTEPTIRDEDDPRFASDQPYQLMDDKDDLPDVALGRVPVRTNTQALAMLEKIKRFENADSEDLRKWSISYVAGEGHFGPYDQLLETMFIQMVDQFVPPEIDVSMLYAKSTSVYCPPPSKLRHCVLDQLGSGSLLFNYVGHGNAFGFDSLHWRDQRLHMLKTADVRQWEGGRPGGLALLTCCSTGWFDRSDGDCLAEVMLHHAAGPVAVIAGSRETHPYANTAVQRRVTQLLLAHKMKTIGELDLRAARALVNLDATDRQMDVLAAPIAAMQQWKTSLIDLRRMHLSLYNLLGDPATKLPTPPQAIEDLRLDGNVLHGKCPGAKDGTVRVLVQTARQGMADAASIIPVTDGNDEELEAKAANNFARANQRTLKEVNGSLSGEGWTVVMPEQMPSAASIIRVWIDAQDANGRSIAYIGAIRVVSQPARKDDEEAKPH